MKIEHHLGISVIISTAMHLVFRSWSLTTASFLSGIFIDLDHVIDYILVNGFRYDSKHFFEYFYEEQHKKITLIFHGWEWLIFLYALMILTDFNFLVMGLFVGYGHHIISDYLYSKASFRSYSVFWRWKHDFNSELIFPRNRGYNKKAR